MKTGLYACTMAIVVLASATALAQEPKDPLGKLSVSYDYIAQGKYDEALNLLVWCFDEGPALDPTFAPIKATCVVDAMATVIEAHPAALHVIRAKRDAKLAQIGDKIDLRSPILHDLMLLNCVLGDFNQNQDFVQYAAKDGSIKKFSSGTPPPAPPTFVSPKITKRVKQTVQLLQVADDATATDRIRGSSGRCGNELEYVKNKEKVVMAEISTLRAALKDAKTPEDKGTIADKLSLRVQEAELEIKPMKKDLTLEIEYYNKLIEWHKSIPA